MTDIDDVYNAKMMDDWEKLSPEERLAAHSDDSYGGCVICKEYVPYTDDESYGVRFPCAPVKLARIAELKAMYVLQGQHTGFIFRDDVMKIINE